MCILGKKFELKPFTTPYNILYGLSEKYDTIDEHVRYLGIPKQNISYWLNKLEKEGLTTKVEHGIYEITWDGKNILRTLEKQSQKDLIRLENMRYKYPIHDGLDSFIKTTVWTKIQSLNNIEVYHTEIYDHTVRVFAGKNNPCLEITCPKRHGYDIYEMMYTARTEIEMIARKVEEEYKVKLGNPSPSMKPEWAIPSPMAGAILNLTQSSQIRTPNGTINRSKGRNADLETRDIRLAHDILMIPKKIDEICNEISKIKTIIGKQQMPEFYNN